MRSWARTWAVAAIAVASVMTGAACTSRDVPTVTPGSATPTLQAPSLDARGLAEQRAVAAYRGMWQAFSKAGQTANAQDPDLSRYAADVALKTLVTGLEANKMQGLVSRGDVVLNPQVTALTPPAGLTEASIRDCADTTHAVRVKASGEPFTDTPGGHRLVIATAKDVGGGTWKVTGFAISGVGSC